MSENCYYCHKGAEAGEMRPYGPNMSWVHFDCMMEASDREKAAANQFSMQLDSAIVHGEGVALLTENGPVPIDAATGTSESGPAGSPNQPEPPE